MASPNDPITERQKDYIRSLVQQRDITHLPEAQAEFLSDVSDENLGRMTKHQASQAIQALLTCPYKQATPTPSAPANEPFNVNQPHAEEEQPKTREGHFFIVDPFDGKEKFFRVKHGKDGTRWQGYVFLDVQASDYFYPVKDKIHRDLVLSEINKDPVKAMNEYGLRLGRCGVCNRTLTDVDSRLRGIGPICAANLDGEPTDSQLEALRQLGLIK